VPDGFEIDHGMDPLDPADDAAMLDPNADPDGDGLTNAEEDALGTDKFDADTDNDGLKDGAEVKKHKTDPLDADTDNGGVNDGDEVANGTNPLDGSDDNGNGGGNGSSDDDGFLPSTGATIGLGALLAALAALVSGLVIARKRRQQA
jgi:LPXTG-motif cell wall-anchored protein